MPIGENGSPEINLNRQNSAILEEAEARYNQRVAEVSAEIQRNIEEQNKAMEEYKRMNVEGKGEILSLVDLRMKGKLDQEGIRTLTKKLLNLSREDIESCHV